MGKTKLALFLMLLVSSSVFLQSFRVQAQAGNPRVHIEPSQTENLVPGDEFTVYVWVDNAPAIVGVQVQITYDPTVLNVTKVDEGPFLLSVGPTALAQHEAIENLETVPPTGWVYYSSSLQGAGALIGASGSGVLLNVTFRVVSEGASAFHLIPYQQAYVPGRGIVEDGVFFLTLEFVNIIPNLKDGSYGTPVSLLARPEVINIGENTTISGRVTGDAAASITSVNLEYVKEGGSWTFLSALPTNESGFFTYQFNANKTADYQFRVYFTVDGKQVQSLVTVVTVEDISSHFYYVYYVLVALILTIATVVAVYYIRKRHKPEEIPEPS